MTDAKTLSPPRQSTWQHDDEDSLDDDSMMEDAPDGNVEAPARRQSTWQHDDEDSLDDDSMA